MATQSIFEPYAAGRELWDAPGAAAADVPARILIADDQPDVRFALRLLLKNEGYETRSAAGPAEVLRAVEAGEADVVVLDLNYTRDTTSGGEGLELIPQIRRLDPTLPILAM